VAALHELFATDRIGIGGVVVINAGRNSESAFNVAARASAIAA